MFVPYLPLDLPVIPNNLITCECILPAQELIIRKPFFIINGKKYSKIIFNKKEK